MEFADDPLYLPSGSCGTPSGMNSFLRDLNNGDYDQEQDLGFPLTCQTPISRQHDSFQALLNDAFSAGAGAKDAVGEPATVTDPTADNDTGKL